ncbi:hypothetical protein [Pseudosporangium ferrugineum]|uniref:PH (Pleckstrin Homology) domain-containing protein n=1 Tax=Pseudosporangium ferrugineum TaxID=439699 RepID=A0A2T0S4E6_9ACTN|nr:hypothetical protein [Pseudosporangium ferrugineum]PRY28294.1 hypothetical protein CLV70_10886 [Pseudosporangium ferrugineum]
MKVSIGAPRAAKAFGVAFGLVFAAAGAAFVLLPLVFDGWLQRALDGGEPCPSRDAISGIPPSMLPPEFRDCLSGSARLALDEGFGSMRLLGFFGVPVFLLGLYLALRTWRTAAWLDGTTVAVRGALRTKKIDLATADVTAGSYTLRRYAGTTRASIEQVPQLVARDPGSGRSVTIPLRGIGTGQLPAAELRALADALRPGSPVAAQLRELAG